jgi:preprotein translocase subunit SecB
MAEDTSGASQASNGEQQPAADGAQDRQEDLRLEINTQYVKDLSFENPNAPLIYTETQENPELEVQIDVASNRLHERVFEAVLKTRIVAKAKDKVVFLVELEYAGLITLGSGIPDSDIQPLLQIEAPRHLFPFARAILSNATRDGGFPPLLINPVDFAELYLRKQQAAAKTAESAEAAEEHT